jgi:hypothetical protein
MDGNFNAGLGFGFIIGIIFGLAILDHFYKTTYKKMMDEVVIQYKSIIDHFGIKKNKNDRWELTTKDLNEVWVKKC